MLVATESKRNLLSDKVNVAFIIGRQVVPDKAEFRGASLRGLN